MHIDHVNRVFQIESMELPESGLVLANVQDNSVNHTHQDYNQFSENNQQLYLSDSPRDAAAGQLTVKDSFQDVKGDVGFNGRPVEILDLTLEDSDESETSDNESIISDTDDDAKVSKRKKFKRAKLTVRDMRDWVSPACVIRKDTESCATSVQVEVDHFCQEHSGNCKI